MTQEIKRWQEIMFFSFCHKMMKKYCRDTKVLFGVIEGLSLMGDYNSYLAKQAAMNVLTDMRYKPNKLEIIELGTHLGVSPTAIRRIFRYNHKSYYDIKNNPRGILFMPRLPIAQYDAMVKFMEAYIKLKGVYDYDTTRQNGPLGPFQDTWGRRSSSKSLRIGE